MRTYKGTISLLREEILLEYLSKLHGLRVFSRMEAETRLEIIGRRSAKNTRFWSKWAPKKCWKDIMYLEMSIQMAGLIRRSGNLVSQVVCLSDGGFEACDLPIPSNSDVVVQQCPGTSFVRWAYFWVPHVSITVVFLSILERGKALIDLLLVL